MCPECDGSTRLVLRKRRWRLPSPWRLAGTLATPAGTVVRWSASLPGVLGAGAVSYGVAAVAHSLAPRVPLAGMIVAVAGVFALALDRRL